MKANIRVYPLFLLSLAYFLAPQISAQDWVHTGTNLGNERIRLAAADFKPVGSDPETTPLKATFDSTLYNDLSNAGIFDMVSKSLAPGDSEAASAALKVSLYAMAAALPHALWRCWFSQAHSRSCQTRPPSPVKAAPKRRSTPASKY